MNTAADLTHRLTIAAAAVGLLCLTCLAVLGLIAAAAAIARWAGRRQQTRQDAVDAATRAALYAHLDDYVAANADLDAGFARLEAAIREQQKGEQA